MYKDNFISKKGSQRNWETLISIHIKLFPEILVYKIKWQKGQSSESQWGNTWKLGVKLHDLPWNALRWHLYSACKIIQAYISTEIIIRGSAHALERYKAYIV